ncbi:TAXI family TRAP transporter solute-binding subunit [Desulfofundulus thermocisternus]|uniref:TAXI family TRAP transporter solute-binding subunit n=1 Tax=Desulfofundulus thermocisternus TaxID=42471 RepID=UPI001A06D278|nr:TAXI family TRAP transporter solute-binding subunit [Desulfofundulus thermocisternus]MBE3586049.1 TAXI family TRAP transporter solute-binding subunit [Thermoanaerobacter sp.]MCS5695019.1 TAXI family TRAP transporter solute-binding subunit [Desulfofundulus thermocisternus]
MGQNDARARIRWLAVGILCLLLLLASAAGCAGSSKDDKAVQKSARRDISVGTGGTGGVYQVVGTAIANLINEKLPYVRATPEPAPVLTQTARFLNSGEFTIGLVSSDVMAFARQGTYTFAGEKLPNLRTLLAGHEVGMAYVVLEDSPVKSLADLRGRKVGCTSPGISLPLQELLRLYGIKPEEVTITYITFAQQVEALKNRTIDMAVLSAYPRASALMDLTESTRVRFISADEDKMAKFVKKHPYWKPREIPANTYKGQTRPYAGAPGQYLLVGVNASADPQLVYDITRVIVENNGYLAEAHPAGKEYTLEQVKKYLEMGQITAPFHPGAAKLLREKGVQIPDTLVE